MRLNALAPYCLFAILALVTIHGCGKEKKTNISIAIIPDSPYRIDEDFTFTDDKAETITLKAPWFRARFNVTNSSGQLITITGVRYSYTYRDSKGNTISVDETTRALGDCFILNELADNTTQYLGQSAYDGECKSDVATELDPQVTFDGFPKDSTDHEFTLRLNGWVGNRTDPQGRFNSGTITFKTQ